MKGEMRNRNGTGSDGVKRALEEVVSREVVGLCGKLLTLNVQCDVFRQSWSDSVMSVRGGQGTSP